MEKFLEDQKCLRVCLFAMFENDWKTTNFYETKADGEPARELGGGGHRGGGGMESYRGLSPALKKNSPPITL